MSGTGAALTGLRVLVTRPRERAESLCFLLEDEGAHVVAVPFLELLPPEDERPLLAAAEQLRRFAWIAVASPAGLEALSDAARRAGTSDALKAAKLAVVGPRTARVAEGLGLTVTLTAEPPDAGGLARALLARLLPQDAVLLPAAAQGRRELPELLREAGVDVTEVVAYRSEGSRPAPAVWQALRDAPPDLVLVASPRTLEALLEAEGGRGVLAGAQVVAIGPTTAAALQAEGISPAAVALRPSDEGLVEAAIRARVKRTPPIGE